MCNDKGRTNCVDEMITTMSIMMKSQCKVLGLMMHQRQCPKCSHQRARTQRDPYQQHQKPSATNTCTTADLLSDSMGCFKYQVKILSHITWGQLSLQYCKLITQQSENAEEWMSNLRMKANEFKYKEKDKRPKERYINDINDDRNHMIINCS